MARCWAKVNKKLNQHVHNHSLSNLPGPARAVEELKLGQYIQRKIVPTMENKSDVYLDSLNKKMSIYIFEQKFV